MASFFKKHKAAAAKAVTGNTKSDDKSPAHSPAEDATATAAATPDGGATNPARLLDHDDERFLERLISNDDDDDTPAPALPPRPKTPDLTWESDSDSFQATREAPAPAVTTAATATATKKQNRLSRLFSRKPSPSPLTAPAPGTIPAAEAEREWADLDNVLSNLGIHPDPPPTSTSAKAKGKARSVALTASTEVQSILGQFVLVLKDIMAGVPAASDDLIALLDGRNEVLDRGFAKLPSSMQKLVMQLPKKLTSSLAPGVLAAAAEAQGLKASDVEGEGGLARFLTPRGLGDLVMTPAIVKSMLKAIVNALKLRWPAFIGTSVLWSTAVILLLFVLWYCHKRGKEEREKREKEGVEGKLIEGKEGKGKEVEGSGAVIEEVAEVRTSSPAVVIEPPVESPRS